MNAFDLGTLSPTEVLAEAARRARNRAAGRSVTDDGADEAPQPTPSAARDVVTRVRVDLSIPWSALVPDNRKYVPALKRSHGSATGRPVLLLSPTYRAGKKKATTMIHDQLRALRCDMPLFPMPVTLALEAQLFEPDRRTRRDVTNYAKLIHDAMTSLVYADDVQLDRVTWIRAGVDIDRPRLELAVSVISR